MQEDGFAEADRVPIIRLERKPRRAQNAQMRVRARVTWCNASSTSLGVCRALIVRENSSNTACISAEPSLRAETITQLDSILVRKPILPSVHYDRRQDDLHVQNRTLGETRDFALSDPIG